MKSRGASTPADEHEVRGSGSQRKGRADTVGSPAAGCTDGLGADTVVSLEREVVSGHAYAVLAPDTECGYDKPTFLSVDGVSDP
jgi:hypothetical protein